MTLKIQLWTTQQHSCPFFPLFFRLRQVKTLLVLFHCWLCTRNGTPATYFLGSFENSGYWCADCRLGLFLCSQLLALTLLHSPLQGSILLVHLFLPHFSLPVNFPWLRVDRVLCEQTVLSAVTFCGCVDGLIECLLGNWQVGTLSHHRN